MSEPSANHVLAASGRLENKETRVERDTRFYRFWLAQSNYGVYCGGH